MIGLGNVYEIYRYSYHDIRLCIVLDCGYHYIVMCYKCFPSFTGCMNVK